MSSHANPSKFKRKIEIPLLGYRLEHFFAKHALLLAGNVGESNQNSFPYSLPIQCKMAARHKTNEQKKDPLPELNFFQSNREAKHKTVNFGLDCFAAGER